MSTRSLKEVADGISAVMGQPNNPLEAVDLGDYEGCWLVQLSNPPESAIDYQDVLVGVFEFKEKHPHAEFIVWQDGMAFCDEPTLRDLEKKYLPSRQDTHHVQDESLVNRLRAASTL
jgi:hypothetical protein